MLGVQMTDSGYDYVLPVPGAARLPIELEPPEGFDPRDVLTWPDVTGRLEYVGGRLLYMPPCGNEQAATAARVSFLLEKWRGDRREILVASNESGMIFGEDVRAPDVAIWRRRDLEAPLRPVFALSSPLLAVEVAGRRPEDAEAALREKSEWYLRSGTATVWIVLPATGEVIAIDREGQRRCGVGERVPGPRDLPDLSIEVSEIFAVL